MLIVVGFGETNQTLDLLTAINEKESEVLQELLDSGIDLNKGSVPAERPLDGAYPLHLAVVIGNKEIVQVLLDSGAKIDLKARNKDEGTPLHWAAFFAQKEMVPLLTESEAPMNVLDANN